MWVLLWMAPTLWDCRMMEGRGAALLGQLLLAAWDCRMFQEEGLLWGSCHSAGLQNIGREKGLL